jgi:hypothetical protein
MILSFASFLPSRLLLVINTKAVFRLNTTTGSMASLEVGKEQEHCSETEITGMLRKEHRHTFHRFCKGNCVAAEC